MCKSSQNRGRVGLRQCAVWASIALFFLGSTVLRAQDVAEAARQEQARKAAQKSTPKHVCTDDDLKKQTILAPEDGQNVAERKREQEETAAKASDPQQQVNVEAAQTESLGEVARRYRKEKAAREAEEAAERNYAPFRYDMPQPATATPKSNVGPSMRVAPENKGPSLSDGIRPVLPQTSQGNPTRGRLSPFQPRPMMAPPALVSASPVVRRSSSVSASAPASITVPSRSKEIVSGAGLRGVAVQLGDSWWKLARVYLGSGSRWPELRALNPGAPSSPELLRPGSRVLVPGEKRSSQGLPNQSRGPTRLRIRPGDTLWTVAKEHLGQGSAWTCLANVNPQIRDYRRMAIGTTIDLPDAQMEASCAAPVTSIRR